MPRPTKFDEDEILDRAMITLWRRGWSQTSIRDLEEALELKAPSIYRRFGTKAGLGVAVIEHYIDRIVRRRVDRFLSGEGDPIDNIGRFLERSVTESGDGDRLWGCMLTSTPLSAVEIDAELAAAIRRGLEVIEDGLRAEVGRAEAGGRLADGVEPGAATATMTLVMQGLMALARSGVPPADLRRRARLAVEAIAADQEAL